MLPPPYSNLAALITTPGRTIAHTCCVGLHDPTNPRTVPEAGIPSMITSNKPHSERDDSHAQASSAALRGALSAFAGPYARTAPQQRPAAPSRPVTSEASHTVSSHGQSAPSRAFIRSTQPPTPTGFTSSSQPPRPNHPARPTAHSAAAVAAQRSAGGDKTGPGHGTTTGQPFGRSDHLMKPSQDVSAILPTSGTVQSAKDYFYSLSMRDADAHSGLPLTPQDKHAPAVVSRRIRPQPQLSVNTTGSPEAAIIRAQGLPNEIQSPKPIRSKFAAAPLEAVVSHGLEADQSPEATFHTPLEISNSFDGVADKKPQPPPPRRSVQSLAVSESQRPTTSYVPPNRQRRSPLRPPPTATGSIARPKSEDAIPRVKSQMSTAGNTVDLATARRIDSMANAIVAGHLASSRVPSRSGSPAKSTVPPLPHQLTDSQHVLYPGLSPSTAIQHVNRTPSPRKAIRQTMRTPISAVDPNVELAEKHKRSHFHMRKHPNKHREGDRKRWRDEITDAERKRYDGLWAANRGLWVEPLTDEYRLPNLTVSELEQCVSNLVVRDMWSRSRLPPHVLEEVWELVDRQGLGRLTREAFVVGLWLIDQRLKGRKLPVDVSDSIWHSARGIHGLKIPKVKH